MMTRNAALKYLHERDENTLAEALDASPEHVRTALDFIDKRQIRGAAGKKTTAAGVIAIRRRSL